MPIKSSKAPLSARLATANSVSRQNICYQNRKREECRPGSDPWRLLRSHRLPAPSPPLPLSLKFRFEAFHPFVGPAVTRPFEGHVPQQSRLSGSDRISSNVGSRRAGSALQPPRHRAPLGRQQDREPHLRLSLGRNNRRDGWAKNSPTFPPKIRVAYTRASVRARQ